MRRPSLKSRPDDLKPFASLNAIAAARSSWMMASRTTPYTQRLSARWLAGPKAPRPDRVGVCSDYDALPPEKDNSALLDGSHRSSCQCGGCVFGRPGKDRTSVAALPSLLTRCRAGRTPSCEHGTVPGGVFSRHRRPPLGASLFAAPLWGVPSLAPPLARTDLPDKEKSLCRCRYLS